MAGGDQLVPALVLVVSPFGEGSSSAGCGFPSLEVGNNCIMEPLLCLWVAQDAEAEGFVIIESNAGMW